MKMYSNKSNAKRAAVNALTKNLGLDKKEVQAREGELFTIEQHSEGGCFWRRVQTEVKLTQRPVTTNKVSLVKLSKPAKKLNTTTKIVNKPSMPISTKRNVSVVENPCKLVWDIADSMPGARRKDVIQACQNAGVAFYTARTQFQLWFKAQGG